MKNRKKEKNARIHAAHKYALRLEASVSKELCVKCFVYVAVYIFTATIHFTSVPPTKMLTNEAIELRKNKA